MEFLFIQSFFGGLIQIIVLILGLLLAVVFFFQGGKYNGIGSVLSGTDNSDLFASDKASPKEKRMRKTTLILITSLMIISFIAFILVSFNLIAFV